MHPTPAPERARPVNRLPRPIPSGPFDVAVLGGGLAGLATAVRLQACGLSTVVVESHGHPGGCAGYFRQRGISFDVGATTLVDFESGGVGAELLHHLYPQVPSHSLARLAERLDPTLEQAGVKPVRVP